MLKVVKLTQYFLNENAKLTEALHDKDRPYSVVTIVLNDLTFAIPLRTNLNHKFGVQLDTIRKGGRTYRRGIDFTKAVLVRDETTELGVTHIVPKSQKDVLINKKKVIKNQFERYVAGYVHAAKNDITGTLTGQAYKYSTLVNYHAELGITN
ncbi:type III toxin-antitoxin system TenpIN family toxin [Vibrio astriarenae]